MLKPQKKMRLWIVNINGLVSCLVSDWKSNPREPWTQSKQGQAVIMAAFVAKQMVGNKLSAVKGECVGGTGILKTA